MEEINKKKEKSGSSSCSQDHNQDQDPARRDDIISLKAVNGGIKLGNNEDDSSKPSTWKKTNELELAKVEMGEVMLENKRLKSEIDRIMKDYQALQTRFHEMAPNKSKSHLEDIGNTCIDNNQGTTRQLEDGAHELTLSLGRNTVFDSKNNNRPDFRPHETLKESSGLSLSLDYNKNEGGSKTSTEQVAPMQNSSTDNSLDEPKDESGEAWPPSKVLKNMKNSSGGGGRDDEVVQQPPVKKARVSVRARCDTPTMNDGCQWRKYGQKIAKGNPCPRAYYRCTVAPSCPVRKQVQRCADDMSILITTYEGTHNHSLPISATAMASTTSAAAFMLISGSSTNSGLGSIGSSPTTTNTSTNFASNSVSNLPGLNFNFSDTSRSSPLFLPNSSFLPSLSQPTITLDLTTSSTSSTSISQLSKLAPINFAPRPYPTATNLTFNSLDMSSSNLTNKTLPISWPPNGLLSYNTTNPTTHARTQVGPKPTTNGAMSCDQETFYQTLLQMINPSPNYNILTPNSSNKQPPQPSLETVAATAKVITSDPSFQSVLTAALSTLIGKNNNTNGTSNVGVSAGNPNVVDNCHNSDFTHKVKWRNLKSSTSTLADDGVKASNGCTSSFLSIEPNNTPISPDANLMVISSHLPFPAPSKSTSTS